MTESGKALQTQVMPPTLLSDVPAVRYAQLCELYAPSVYDECGRLIGHDPSLGVITREQLLRLMDLPTGEAS